MKIPEELSRELYKAKSAFAVYEIIVRDCAEQCHRNMYHGTTDIPTINAANHALSDCYKAILARYSLEPEDSHE